MDWSDSLQNCRSGGTLLKICCESSWLPLISSQPLPVCHNHHPNPTKPPQTITCIRHRPTITFWCLFVRTTDQLEHLVWQEDYVLQCLVDSGAQSLYRSLICPPCPFIQGLAARQEREFPSSNSLPRGAPSLILCLGYILMDILHFTFLYILTVYSTFYVSDTFDGYCSWWNFPLAARNWKFGRARWWN